MLIPLKVFKALGDETRLRLFYLLSLYKLNVNEIVEVLEMGQSRVSRHLRVLSECGLLLCKRDGSFAYYYAEQNEDSKLLVEFLSRFLKQKNSYLQDLQRSEAIVAERKKRTRRFFNQVAESWDRIKRDLFGDLDLSAILEENFRQVHIAVDLGCGTGDLLQRLGRYADLTIGVDASQKMLNQAKLKVKGTSGEFDFRLGELEHLPLKDAEADLAVVNMVLHHIAVPALAIEETYRVLKPDGQLLLADLDKHESEEVKKRFGGSWMGFAKEEVIKWLEDTGFSVQGTADYAVRFGLKLNIFKAVK
ncbi:MAG: ArsR/SmtB family transcription factor [Thermodesulfobacteriota bacterium]